VKHILAKAQEEILARFAWSNVLLGFDFDGTLAPIVESPSEAAMRPSTKQLMISLAGHYPTAVLSGRSQSDVRERMSGVALREIVGNHGLEPGGDMPRYQAIVARWLPLLRERLGVYQGVEIEDKTYSLAIHFRKSRERKVVLRAIEGAVASLGAGVRSVGGKLVVNLIPEGAPHKGLALKRLHESLKTDTALYVGDDTTDEDVFGFDEILYLLCIRVGRSSTTRAAYYISSQGEMDDLLGALDRLRVKQSQRREGSASG
jgi:trehalose 6-phosphate phosphatase